MKSNSLLFLLLMAVFMPWTANAQTVTIGDVSSGTSHSAAPIEQNYNYSFVEMLVPATEIAIGNPTTNTIVSLGFYSPTGSNGFDYTFTVYMKNIDITEFDATMVPVSNADVVFTGTLVPETNAWTTFELDKAFVYDPTKTLFIAVNKTAGHKDGSSSQNAGSSYKWQYTATTTNTVLMAHRDAPNAYDPTTAMPVFRPISNWQKTYRPNMQITFGTAPSCNKPTALTLGTITGHTAELSWTSSASAWQICLNDDETQLIDVATTSYTLQGLSGETTYTAKVRTKCSDSDFSGWSSSVSFNTEITCPKPTGLTATLTSGNGSIATLSWTETGEASDWVLEYGTAPDFTRAISVNVSGTPSKDLTHLTAETTYYARVKASCGDEDGESAWSNTITFTPTNDYFITVNDPANATNNYVPVFGTWVDDYTRSQFIIPATDLTDLQEATITKLTFYGTNTGYNPHWDGAKFEVYLTETNETTLSALADWNTMEKVVNAAHLEISDGKMVVTLNTPYPYMGGNLMIGFYQTASGLHSSCSWQGVTAATGASMGGYGTSINQQSFLPKVTFYYNTPSTAAVFITDGNWGDAGNWLGGTVPEQGTDVTIQAKATIPAGYTAIAGEVTVEGSGSITISDGGQLQHNTTGLEVTMKKNIPAYTGTQDNYRLLAFPFSDEVAVPAAMTAAEGNDFYTFDNSKIEMEWQNNRKVAIETVSAFNGYLYANPEAIELSLTGPTYATNTDIDILYPYTADENYRSGWMLSGNPFTCDVYLYDGQGNPLTVMFYDENGTDMPIVGGGTVKMTTLTAGPVPPMQGFFVKLSNATRIYFKPSE